MLLAGTGMAAAAAAPPPWQTLPPTPGLPPGALQAGRLPVNGVGIWHAVYGAGPPVVMLHGGLANADYWGLQVPALAQRHTVVVMDSRGHGRSTRDGRPFGYDLMADDVIGVLDALGIAQAAVVGWSDGAILGLDLALRHPARVSRVFAFAANATPGGVVPHAERSPVFARFVARAATEYRRLSPTPDGFGRFEQAIGRMWATQPDWTAGRLGTIALPVLVVDGDHDEAIRRSHTEWMAACIPRAGLLIQPDVSHFSFLQAPSRFTADVRRFLQG